MATAALVVLIASLYGASDEFHQSFVPGREPSIADWLADVAGAIAAVACVVWGTLRQTKRRVLGA